MPAQTKQPKPTSSSRKPRIVRSKATWQHIMDQYDSSSQTQADFCRDQNIAPMSFYKWRKRLSKETLSDHFIDISPSMVIGRVNGSTAVKRGRVKFMASRARIGSKHDTPNPHSLMFFPESTIKIWLYNKPTDMRKSFDGLSALVKNKLC